VNYYKYNNQTVCDTFCPDGQYIDDINSAHVCALCDVSCVKCSIISTNCSFCKSIHGIVNVFLYQINTYDSQCLTSCPSGYWA
jgi:hypothetical protein